MLSQRRNWTAPASTIRENDQVLFYLAFDQYLYLKTDTNIYTLYRYSVIYNIGRAAIEASASQTTTIFMFIHVQKV